MKKTKLLLSLTSLTTIGLASSTLASCGCSNPEQEDVKVTSIIVKLNNKEYFKVGETLSKNNLKVTATTSDGKGAIVDYNSDGENGYKLLNTEMGHVFDDNDVNENYELKISYKGVTNSVKFTVSANVGTYNENLQFFELSPVVTGKDIVATFSPKDGYILDWERTGLYIGEDVYTAEDDPDVITFDYASDGTKYTMKVAGSVVTSTVIDLGIRCKEPETPVEKITLNKEMIQFTSGSTQEETLTATVTPAAATETKVNWSITKGSELINITPSGTKNGKCKITSLGTSGEAEVTCTSESTPSISAKCKIMIIDSTIKLTGKHNFDTINDPYISISAETSAVSQLYWSVSDTSLATLQDGSVTGVKVYPTENAKKYGGFVYVYAKDSQQNIQASFPISFGTFSLLNVTQLKNGVAKWCEQTQSGDVSVVIPSWYIYTENEKLYGKEIVSYATSTLNVTNIKSIFIPYSIHTIPAAAFKSLTNLSEIIIDYDNTVYTSGGNKDETLNKRFNAVVNRSTKTLIAGCKGSWLDNVEDSPIQTIGSEAFSETGLTTINIPSNIHEIEKYAFSNCSTLTNVTFSGITTSKWTISDDDYTKCETLTLDSTSTTAATQIRGNAAYTWNNINYVEFKEVTDTTTGTKSYEVYTEEANVSKIVGKLVIPSKHGDKEVTGIYYNETTDAGGFEECSQLESVYIPSTITYISKFAFRNCLQLSQCVAEKLEYIDQGAFHYTGSLQKIDIKNNALIALGMGAFAEGGLHEFTIPATCVTIGRGCFLTSMLREVTIEKPTTGRLDWKCILGTETISIDEYCISKGKDSIYTNKKVAANMLRFGYSETAKLWGFGDRVWDTTFQA